MGGKILCLMRIGEVFEESGRFR